MMADSQSCTSVDLFAGAGGLTLGLQRAGFASLSIDNWTPAIQTLRQNFGDDVVLSDDVRDLSGESLLAISGGKQPLVVAGGPPCQGFTSAGARRACDDRNTLVGEFARLVAEVRPTWFLFENVEGFLTMSGGDFVVDLLDPIVDAGYSVRLRKVNVANYGVPQLRKRVIALGSLEGDPGFPKPSHRAFGAPGAHTDATASLPASQTVDEALTMLPTAASTAAQAPLQGHHSTPPTGHDADRVIALQSGQTMRDLPKALQHDSFPRRANRRVADGMPTERRGGTPAGIRRLRPDEPSKAITSAAVREFIHPTEHRHLTLRECARLQGFPDDFEFIGSLSDQATLVGNAIPPALGEVFGNWIARRTTEIVNEQPPPRGLLEFFTTNSAGMSPSLRRVVERINARYETGARPLWR